MRLLHTAALTGCLLAATVSYAQKEKLTREDKDEKNQARTTRIKDKTDIAVFHRQMLSLKEYNDERKKIPAIQRANKMPVKVVAVVDTTGDLDDEASRKTLVGYIRQDIGDNSTVIYDVTFDREQKKIVGIKHNAEAGDAENTDNAAPKKTAPVKAAHKNKDEDDDDDTGDEPPAKSKSKDKDDDKD